MGNYKDRMRHEYLELAERQRKLKIILFKAKAHKLDFELDCPIELLWEQHEVMKKYMDILELRAVYEEVDLND